MRKSLIGVLALFVMLSFNIGIVAAEGNSANPVLNTDKVNVGAIGITYLAPKGKKTKVVIEKRDRRYIYNISAAKTYNDFPLQMGNGEYTIKVMENTTGNSYKVVAKEKVEVNIANDKLVYLNSVQNVRWDDSMEAVKKAKALTKNARNDSEKVKLIYNYIVNNIKYDFKKANEVNYDYLPDIDNTLKVKYGICYDYAALFAAMLRSADVPTKLVTGNTAFLDEYHAWNEVYIDGKWQIVDTTIGASEKASKKAEMFKSKQQYMTAKEY
ncbi:transglutaminase-like domain-containing protein [Paenibacillus tarimensis]